MKQALLAMDDNVLTPELLRQILAYAPDTKEVGRHLLEIIVNRIED